jgi:serine/threonine-protein phosphatase 2A regulatory subunit A
MAWCKFCNLCRASNSLRISFYQALLTHFSQPHITTDGLQIYRKLQQDDQDSVRLLTVEDLIVIAKRLSGAEVKEQLLRQIKQSIGDKSWRVRYMAANHFNEVCFTKSR